MSSARQLQHLGLLSIWTAPNIDNSLLKTRQKFNKYNSLAYIHIHRYSAHAVMKAAAKYELLDTKSPGPKARLKLHE